MHAIITLREQESNASGLFHCRRYNTLYLVFFYKKCWGYSSACYYTGTNRYAYNLSINFILVKGLQSLYFLLKIYIEYILGDFEFTYNKWKYARKFISFWSRQIFIDYRIYSSNTVFYSTETVTNTSQITMLCRI